MSGAGRIDDVSDVLPGFIDPLARSFGGAFIGLATAQGGDRAKQKSAQECETKVKVLDHSSFSPKCGRRPLNGRGEGCIRVPTTNDVGELIGNEANHTVRFVALDERRKEKNRECALPAILFLPDSFLVGMFVRGGAVLMSVLAVRLGAFGMLFGGFVIAVFVVMRRWMMMMRRGRVGCGGIVMVFGSGMLGAGGHGVVLNLEKWERF